MDDDVWKQEQGRRRWPWFVVLGFALILWLLAGAVSLFGDPEAVFWRQVLNDRLEAAAQERSEPAIFVGGGSSCSFSIHADVLEAETGWRAFNLGGSAAMGYRSLIALATSEARSGDVVVLHLEPAILRDEVEPISPLGQKVHLGLNHDGAGWGMFWEEANQLTFAEKLAILRPGAKFLGVLGVKLLTGTPPYRYRMEDRLENGTLTLKTNEGNPDVEGFRPMEGWVGPRLIHDFTLVQREAAARGIQVFYVLPWEAFQEEVLSKQQAEHERYLTGIAQHFPVLREDEAGVISDNSLFLDTGFHLTEMGGRARSRALARALKPHLPTDR